MLRELVYQNNPNSIIFVSVRILDDVTHFRVRGWRNTCNQLYLGKAAKVGAEVLRCAHTAYHRQPQNYTTEAAQAIANFLKKSGDTN